MSSKGCRLGKRWISMFTGRWMSESMLSAATRAQFVQRSPNFCIFIQLV